ncbi:SpoIIE family protein phosphatase [Streptomyces sp. NPDC017979]|uniref:SpoIIE family protein phosphatase n=1 Tax=Streptomyces sp. NPDC017979 TaxID=3365024 RepID=UPI0037ADFCF8
MRRDRARAHADCVTWYGATEGTPPRRRRAAPGTPRGGGSAPDRLALELAQAAVGAVEAVGGHAAAVYLRSPSPDLLKLAVLAGLPSALFRPWWRAQVNRPLPVSEVHRSGRAIHFADAEEAMRRFPQLMAGLPFPFGALYAPVSVRAQKFGVLFVLRRATPGRSVAVDDRHRIRTAAHRLAATLGALADDGVPVAWEGEPLSVQLPALNAPPVRTGRFGWDLVGGDFTADEGMRAVLGPGSAGAPGTIAELTDLLSPEDAVGLWALARQAAALEHPVPRRIRLRGPDGVAHLVEVSADGTRLDGSLVDLGGGPLVTEASDRLPYGVLSLDRLCRITYLNTSAETLVGRARPDLMGRVLWEALPWLAPGSHEDHYRAALIAETAAFFVVRRPEGEWLEVRLHPAHDGVTATLTPAESPDRALPAPAVLAPDAPGAAGALSERSSALYRPVALAIALTEAVTARQVSAVVTEELLPAFGGRQLAIYLLHERHLFLAWETGFPHGFLDRFDGVGLDARLPGVETLTSGRPIFFESMEHLAAAYPGIPLDAHVGARAFLPLIASGRPVGSCILGFDQPRAFSPEERTVLTALAGLIAQALERARRYDTEAAVARGLQDVLLPHRLPTLDTAGAVGRYLPGTQGMEVGGDWYDVVVTGDRLALVIGDVQGHGVAAAATMGQVRSAVRAFALSGNDPEQVVSGTNRLLIDLDPGQFASCCYIVLDPATGRTQAVRAGHPQPLLRHPGGRTEVLDLAGGIVLGVDPAAAYPVTELVLDPGAVLALYTDGLVERAGRDIDVGIETVRRTLADCGDGPLHQTADQLIREARRSPDRPDDIALLLATRWA